MSTMTICDLLTWQRPSPMPIPLGSIHYFPPQWTLPCVRQARSTHKNNNPCHTVTAVAFIKQELYPYTETQSITLTVYLHMYLASIIPFDNIMQYNHYLADKNLKFKKVKSGLPWPKALNVASHLLNRLVNCIKAAFQQMWQKPFILRYTLGFF